MDSRIEGYGKSLDRFHWVRKDWSDPNRVAPPFKDELHSKPNFIKSPPRESARERIRRENESFERNVARKRDCSREESYHSEYLESARERIRRENEDFERSRARRRGSSRERSHLSAHRRRRYSRRNYYRVDPGIGYSEDARAFFDLLSRSEKRQYDWMADDSSDDGESFTPSEEIEFEELLDGLSPSDLCELWDDEGDRLRHKPRFRYKLDRRSDFRQDYPKDNTASTMEEPHKEASKSSSHNVKSYFTSTPTNADENKSAINRYASFKSSTLQSVHSVQPESQAAAKNFSNAFSEKMGDTGDDEPVIPNFNSETSKLSAEEWMRLIDDAAGKYEYKEDEMQYILASRLSGYARQWYLSVGINFKTWGELRREFLTTFPNDHDFHALLTKMLRKVREAGETMASYFHHKVALLNACEIEGTKAVSCIIAGLSNPKLEDEVRMQCYQDPDELYAYLRTVIDDLSKDVVVRKSKDVQNEKDHKPEVIYYFKVI